jgi:hypothetical protein
MADIGSTISLQGFEVVYFNLLRKPTNDFVVPQKLHFSLQAQAGVAATKQLSVVVHLAITEEGKPDIKFVEASTVFGYGLENFDSLIKQLDHNSFFVPDEIDYILKTTSVSTLRGILHGKLSGTYMQMATLPFAYLAFPIAEQGQLTATMEDGGLE